MAHKALSALKHRNVRSVPWFRWFVAGLSPRRFGFDPRPVCVRYVVDIVAGGLLFLRLLQFSLGHLSFFYDLRCIILAVESVINLLGPEFYI